MRRRGRSSSLGGIIVILLIVIGYFWLRSPGNHSITVNGPGTATTGTTAVSNGSNGNGNSGNSGGTAGVPHWGVQTKTANCQIHGPLQDTSCTPGALLATGTKDAIC